MTAMSLSFEIDEMEDDAQDMLDAPEQTFSFPCGEGQRWSVAGNHHHPTICDETVVTKCRQENSGDKTSAAEQAAIEH